MFAVLKIIPKEKGMGVRLKHFFSPPEPVFERVNVKGAAPFYRLEIYEKQCKDGYGEVIKMLGSCSKAVIQTFGTDVSPVNGIKIFRPTLLPNIMTVNSAEDFLRHRKYDKTAFTLGIKDRKGAFSQYLEKFVNLAGEVRVFTKNEFAYKSVCDKIYDLYGLSVVICLNERNLGSCDMIISPGNEFDRYFNNCVLVRCGESEYNILKGEGITLPKYIAELLPDGVDSLVFASALYEACALKTLGTLKYDKMTVTGENVFPFGEKSGFGSIDIK